MQSPFNPSPTAAWSIFIKKHSNLPFSLKLLLRASPAGIRWWTNFTEYKEEQKLARNQHTYWEWSWTFALLLQRNWHSRVMVMAKETLVGQKDWLENALTIPRERGERTIPQVFGYHQSELGKEMVAEATNYSVPLVSPTHCPLFPREVLHLFFIFFFLLGIDMKEKWTKWTCKALLVFKLSDVNEEQCGHKTEDPIG